MSGDRVRTPRSRILSGLVQVLLGVLLLVLAWPGDVSNSEDAGRWVGRALFAFLVGLGLRAWVRDKKRQPLWSPWVLVVACVIAFMARMGMAEMEA